MPKESTVSDEKMHYPSRGRCRCQVRVNGAVQAENYQRMNSGQGGLKSATYAHAAARRRLIFQKSGYGQASAHGRRASHWRIGHLLRSNLFRRDDQGGQHDQFVARGLLKTARRSVPDVATSVLLKGRCIGSRES